MRVAAKVSMSCTLVTDCRRKRAAMTRQPAMMLFWPVISAMEEGQRTSFSSSSVRFRGLEFELRVATSHNDTTPRQRHDTTTLSS